MDKKQNLLSDNVSTVPSVPHLPEHDITTLNNDCIQEIFRRVTNLKDFLSTARVCKRFADNAKACVQAGHRKQFCIGDDNDDRSCFSIREARHSNVLKKFGFLINKIVWRATQNTDEYHTDNDDDDEYMDDVDLYNDAELLRQEDDGFIFGAIVEHCGKNRKI